MRVTALARALAKAGLFLLCAAAASSGFAAGYRAVEKEPVAEADRQACEEVRLAATCFFDALKGRRFDRVYDGMPQECREQITRQEFVDAFDPADLSRALALSDRDLQDYRITGIRLTGTGEAEVSAETEVAGGLSQPRRLQERSLWVSREGGWVCPECCAQLVRQAKQGRADALAGMQGEIMRDELYDFIRDD